MRPSVRPKSSKADRLRRHRSKAKGSRPVWEDVLRIARSIPKPDLHKLPTDLAAHHDRYLYGSSET